MSIVCVNTTTAVAGTGEQRGHDEGGGRGVEESTAEVVTLHHPVHLAEGQLCITMQYANVSGVYKRAHRALCVCMKGSRYLVYQLQRDATVAHYQHPARRGQPLHEILHALQVPQADYVRVVGDQLRPHAGGDAQLAVFDVFGTRFACNTRYAEVYYWSRI